MPKALALSGLVVAALLLLIFGMDLAIQIPFGGASRSMDIALLLGSAALGYMAWSTFREQS